MSYECYMNVTFRFCFRSPLKSLKLPVFKGLSTDLGSHSFLHISFYPLYLIPEEKTQAKFIRWVKEVFGWEWNSSDFKGSNVPDAVRTTPLNKWTVEGLSAQRPQAEEYIRWRGLLISSFMEKSPKGRVDCKESFCIRWFDTGVGED